jgi:hypothetical protein
MICVGHQNRSCMQLRARRGIITLLALCTAACSDATGAFNLVALCPQATWAAIEVGDKPWQRIPVKRSALPLPPGERIGLARIRGAAFPDSMQIYYVTTEQAEATFSCSGDTPPTGSALQTKELHGTVQGIGTPYTDPNALGAPDRAVVTMGFRWGTVGAADFTLSNIGLGPTDLVATAFDVGRATIIRRGVDYPDGSTIPVLDFSSSEAFGLQANTVTVTGNPDNYDWQVTDEVITKRGTLGMLHYQYLTPASTTAPVYSVPESKLLDDELNSLTVSVGSSIVTVYYRVPSNRTVEAGPRANLPTVSRSGVGPDLTTRIDVVSQPEYGSQITLSFYPPSTAPLSGSPTSLSEFVTIIASKEYFGGTPATWSFTMPDLWTVEGFPSSFGDVRTSGLFAVLVTDRPYLAPDRDGATYRSAWR